MLFWGVRWIMECHKCYWNTQVPSKEKEEACLTCTPSTRPSGHGQVFVSLDFNESSRADNRNMVDAALRQFALDNDEKSSTLDLQDSEILDAFQQGIQFGALQVIFWLEKLEFQELKLILQVLHKPFSQIAREREKPCTKANISAQWRKIVKKLPELTNIVESNLTRNRNSTKDTTLHARAHARRG